MLSYRRRLSTLQRISSSSGGDPMSHNGLRLDDHQLLHYLRNPAETDEAHRREVRLQAADRLERLVQPGWLTCPSCGASATCQNCQMWRDK